ncbi:MAG: CDP-alcohol phosphatidyltransferase family protein [Candidatus Omnitrophica bacterium]|nr:CDP-alcohol phosphatidyltransferase family protein [Candidatus Omnitrophota bacterium]
MKIVIVDYPIEQKSCLFLRVDSKRLLEYFIDIAKEISAKALKISSPYVEDIREITERKGISVEFIKPEEINSSDVILEGNCLYNKRVLTKLIKKKPYDFSKAILWRIKTPADTQRACETLRRENRFIISRYFMLRWGRGLARFLNSTSITPNQVTLLSLLAAIFAALCFASGQYKFFILGAFFLLLYGTLDFTDGQLARLKNMDSDFGKYLDTIVGMLAQSTMHAGIAWGLFLKHSHSIFILLGYMVIIFDFMYNYIISTTKLQSAEDKKFKEKGMRWLPRLKKINDIFYSWDIRLYLFVIFVIIDKLQIIFLFYAVYFAMLFFYQVIKRYSFQNKRDIVV